MKNRKLIWSLTDLHLFRLFPGHSLKNMRLRASWYFFSSTIIFDLRESLTNTTITIHKKSAKIRMPRGSSGGWIFSVLTCCCNCLNSFGLVFFGTNCRAPSILTGVLLCVGDPSDTHCTQNQIVSFDPNNVGNIFYSQELSDFDRDEFSSFLSFIEFNSPTHGNDMCVSLSMLHSHVFFSLSHTFSLPIHPSIRLLWFFSKTLQRQFSYNFLSIRFITRWFWHVHAYIFYQDKCLNVFISKVHMNAYFHENRCYHEMMRQKNHETSIIEVIEGSGYTGLVLLQQWMFWRTREIVVRRISIVTALGQSTTDIHTFIQAFLSLSKR